MHNGKHLSAYLYFPAGEGPWPVLFEQRYADITGAGTRQTAAKLAEAGYVVAMVNYRGTYKSEGTWVGYRALGWGELKDGYDACQWLATSALEHGEDGYLWKFAGWICSEFSCRHAAAASDSPIYGGHRPESVP